MNPFHAIDLFLYFVKLTKKSDICGFLMFSGGIERDQWYEMV